MIVPYLYLMNFIKYPHVHYSCTSLVAQMIKKKKSACNAGNLGWIPGLGRSPGEGNGIIINPSDRYLR